MRHRSPGEQLDWEPNSRQSSCSRRTPRSAGKADICRETDPERQGESTFTSQKGTAQPSYACYRYSVASQSSISASHSKYLLSEMFSIFPQPTSCWFCISFNWRYSSSVTCSIERIAQKSQLHRETILSQPRHKIAGGQALNEGDTGYSGSARVIQDRLCLQRLQLYLTNTKELSEFHFSFPCHPPPLSLTCTQNHFQ